MQSRRLVRCGVAASVTLGLCVAARAGTWQPTQEFTGPCVGGWVTAAAVYDDGNGPALYCGSTLLNSLSGPGPNIVRYRHGVWQRVGGPRDGVVQDMAVYDDGNGAALYVLGNFGFDSGSGSNVALLRYDGQTWTSFTGLHIGFDAPGALAVFDDGNGPALLIGGRDVLSTYNLVRWDGTGFTGVAHVTGTGIYDLAVYDPDGAGPQPAALIATGDFSQLDGVSVSGIAQRDGSSWAPLGTGLDGIGRTLAVVDLGAGPRLCVGGEFSQAGGHASNPAVWDGQSWSPLGTGTSGGVVRALADFPTAGGTQIVATGKFTGAGGSPASGIAAWDGDTWQALGTGLSFGAYPYDGGRALHVFDDGDGARLFVGGAFKNAGGVLGKVVAWDGDHWQSLEDGVNDESGVIMSLYYASQEHRLYAGGTFTRAGGHFVNHIAAWDALGWHDLGGQLTTNSWSVYGLLTYDDGTNSRLHAIGQFSLADDPNGQGVARWDGASWSALGSGVSWGGGDPSLIAACVFDDGDGSQLYVAGGADMAGGLPVGNVARWNGQTWSPVGSISDGFVMDIVVHDDGSGPALYAAANLYATNTWFVLRWNGTTWSPVGAGFNGFISALASYSRAGAHLLCVAGDFTQVGDTPAGRIAAWNGEAWSALGAGVDDWVYSLAVVEHPGGPTLFAGGEFQNILPAQPCPMLAAWDGESWTPVFSTVEEPDWNVVHALHSAVVDGELSLFISGAFRAVDDTIAGGIARLRYIPTPCLGDMNCDGDVTFADIDKFVAALRGPAAWQADPANAGCPWTNADCSNDGVVTFADIDPFVARLGSVCE